MLGKPFVQALEGPFAERERRIARVFDLRHGRTPDAGEDAQLGAVELTARKLGTQEEQCGNRRGGANRLFFGYFKVSGWSWLGACGRFPFDALTCVLVNISSVPRQWPLQQRKATKSGPVLAILKHLFSL
jgi:hypothetical protein